MPFCPDSPDGVANFGTGIDTVNQVFCIPAIDPEPGTCSCLLPNDLSFASDASIDITSLPGQLNPSQWGRDVFDINRSFISKEGSGFITNHLIQDVYRFVISGNNADLVSFGTNGTQDTVTRSTFNVISTSVDVPEPSVLALMDAGLAGLGFTRRRKQQI